MRVRIGPLAASGATPDLAGALAVGRELLQLLAELLALLLKLLKPVLDGVAVGAGLLLDALDEAGLTEHAVNVDHPHLGALLGVGGGRQPGDRRQQGEAEENETSG